MLIKKQYLKQVIIEETRKFLKEANNFDPKTGQPLTDDAWIKGRDAFFNTQFGKVWLDAHKKSGGKFNDKNGIPIGGMKDVAANLLYPYADMINQKVAASKNTSKQLDTKQDQSAVKQNTFNADNKSSFKNQLKQTIKQNIKKNKKIDDSKFQRRAAVDMMNKITQNNTVQDMSGKEASKSLRADVFKALKDVNNPAVLKLDKEYFYKIPTNVKINISYNPNDLNSYYAALKPYEKYRAYKIIPN